jgi:hypothetical protein
VACRLTTGLGRVGAGGGWGNLAAVAAFPVRCASQTRARFASCLFVFATGLKRGCVADVDVDVADGVSWPYAGWCRCTGGAPQLPRRRLSRAPGLLRCCPGLYELVGTTQDYLYTPGESAFAKARPRMLTKMLSAARVLIFARGPLHSEETVLPREFRTQLLTTFFF